MRRWARALAHRAGFEITRYTPRNYAHLRRLELLRSGRVDVLLDVGAHDGSWALAARRAGFGGRIESFEPQSAPYERLAVRASADGRWRAHRLALSDEAGARVLRLSPDQKSSSLLELGVQEQVDPAFAYTGAETVQTGLLDGLDLVGAEESGYLKADVQGHELAVLRGAERTIRRCAAVELELSFVPLYEGQPLAHDLMAWLAGRGFGLVAVDVSWRHPQTGNLLAANGIFAPAQH
ncbi:MAG TPA: FkbM family methyltransferase [Gaiellaceae bacterium]|nr:FkbM family methyltransferase [Gaiellaceae bacterium]